jgi:vesicular inhibitory amino acid transporter
LTFLFSIAAVAFYSGLLIKRCMEKNSNIITYPDIGELAFGKTGRLIVSISMYTELYLVSAGFLILEGDNLSNLIPIEEFQVVGLSISAKQFFVILVALIILPTVWYKSKLIKFETNIELTSSQNYGSIRDINKLE